MDKIYVSLMNTIFDSVPSHLKPGAADEKVIDIWTKYAERDEKKNCLSYQELNEMIEENLESKLIKRLLPKFLDEMPSDGISIASVNHFVKYNFGGLELWDLTLAEALPACKRGMALSIKREEWQKEWCDRLYIEKNLPKKYQGNEGHKLFMKEKIAEFEKNYKS